MKRLICIKPSGEDGQAVLEITQRLGQASRNDVETELGISQTKAVLLLNQLIENGVVLRQGKGKETKYMWAN